MNMYAAFCRAIDDGLFDEVDGADKAGAERLVIATDPFLTEGSITEEQLNDLSQRLDERKVQRSSVPGAGQPD